MTREDAKAILYEWQEMMVRNGVPIDTSKVQALRVAIETLSAENSNAKTQNSNQETQKSNGDLIYRADAIGAVRKELVCDGRHEAHDKTCRFIADVLLSALPSAETHEIRTETHGVCLISKDDAMGAVQDHFNADGFKGYDDGQKMMDRINALPSADAIDLDESCEKCEHHLKGANEVPCCYCTIGKSFYTPTIHDALSAEAVQTQAEKCDECIHKGTHKDKMTCKECADRALCIMSAPDGKWKACEDYRPSAEDVQGEWVHDGQKFIGGLDWCHCSECGYKTSTNGLSVYRFCPNCGAKMKGVEHEID